MIRSSINLEIFRGAWDGLLSHKLRSILTTLGVIFGVAAVISMASIGEGARQEALAQIELLGASNIIVDLSRPEEGEARQEVVSKNPYGLTRADAEALKVVLKQAVRIVPQRMGNVLVTAGSNRKRAHFVASSPEIFPLQQNKLSAGRFTTHLDEIDSRRVCVLGSGAKRELFPLTPGIGEELRVEGVPLTVVGVLSRQNVGGEIEGFELRDRNKDIYVPLTTAITRFPPKLGESELKRIIVQMQHIETLPATANLIQRILKRRHNNVEDFEVIVPEQLLAQHEETQRIFNIVMITIASISLIVGGIGIMNIMLASVLERTKEIGIRRALGARQSDIARQFLMEAMLLSLFGGVIGVILGILLAFGISYYADWQTAVSWWSIVIAVGVSCSVGIIFGYLPARSAAKLDPIAALRAE